MTARSPRRWGLWLAGALVAAVVAVGGGTFVYIHFISGSAPAPLSLKATSGAAPSPSPAAGQGSAGSPTAGQGGAGSLAGTWKAGSGSVVGYRVQEVLFGQN
jgi:hypothetical protein